MISIEPCKRVEIILSQMITDIVTGAKPSHQEEFKHLMDETLPILEKRTYDLAEKCRISSGCNENTCNICNHDEIKRIFLKAHEDLEKIQNRFEDIKKGDPHFMK